MYKNLSFESACEILSNIECINQGGCGIATLAMLRFCKKFSKTPENFKVATLYPLHNDGLNSFETNMNFVLNKSKEAVGCYHIAFMIGSTIIDVKGPVDMIWYNKILIIPKDKEEQYLVTALNNYGWNPMFNREFSIPFIEKHLQISLSDIKISI